MRASSNLLLLLWCFLLLAVPGNGCEDDDECGADDTCVYGHCAATGCLSRELKDFNSQFDSKQYTQMLLTEAGVTKEELLQARRDHLGDDYGFSQAPPVKRLIEVVQSHSDELDQVAAIVESCQSGAQTKDLVLPDAATQVDLNALNTGMAMGRGIGLVVGYLLAAITNLLRGIGGEGIDPQQTTPSPSASPSLSIAPSASPSVAPSRIPSVSPSAGPTFTVGQKIYLGIHFEGGFIFDGSYTILFPSDTTTNVDGQTSQWARACLGAEIGGGGEISFVILIANLRENNDIQGTSLLAEFLEVGVGFAVGAGVGVYLDGPSTRDGNDPVHYEITLGLGLGGALVGGSICRTNICEVIT